MYKDYYRYYYKLLCCLFCAIIFSAVFVFVDSKKVFGESANEKYLIKKGDTLNSIARKT